MKSQFVQNISNMGHPVTSATALTSKYSRMVNTKITTRLLIKTILMVVRTLHVLREACFALAGPTKVECLSVVAAQ